jgi:eukaryotic-like serine/threonine-protein kinase
MIFPRLRVFVSSKMQELAPERQALKLALDDLKVDAWVFEQDAGARPESIQKAFLDEVEAADLYVGLFWTGYGDYTIEEYEHARKLGKDCLIYEKRADLDGERDPRLQAFLDRVGNVETGLTIKWFNEPAELTEAIKNDIQRLQARIFRERRASRITRNLTLAEEKERNELLILLCKVKEFWIEGVLGKSVHGQALIELGKEAWTENTAHPWEQVLELPNQTSRTLRPEEPIDKIFDDIGRSLLILGAPGAGKTITLLTLAREVIAQAETDPAQPIPVVFNLSSWTDPKTKLLDWLIDELLVKYQVPKKMGSRWLEANWIVPLLDGLDEVTTANQPACVEAINTYVQNNGAPGLAVCSRLKEYTGLPVRLQVTGAICLQPLTPEQVKNYVAGSGKTLTGLRVALTEDLVLQTLSETPLMLDIMTMAYRDLPAEELASETVHTEKERRSHLFDRYIDKMFSRKGKGTQEFTEGETVGWLAWLARGMQQQGQTVFLLEQLQPSWLNTRCDRIIYIVGSRTVCGLLIGLIFGLIYSMTGGGIVAVSFGVVPGLIDAWRFSRFSISQGTEKGGPHYCLPTFIILAVSLSGVLAYALRDILTGRWSAGEPVLLVLFFYGLFIGLTFALTGGLFWGLRSLHRNVKSDVRSVETLRWSWPHAKIRCGDGLIYGLIGGLTVVVIFGLIVWVNTGRFPQRSFLVVNSLVAAVGCGVIGGLFGGLRGTILAIKAVPNLGIKMSIRNAVIGSGFGLLVFGVFGVLMTALSFSDAFTFEWDGSNPFLLLVFGLFGFFWYGGQDVIQHYILRFILYWKGHAPFRYADFLDYAARLVFLQKVGGGYIFIHRLLLEHFAAMCTDGKQPAAR